MKTVSIVFPHQLFKNHPALQDNTPVYLLEETLFFSQYNFHKKKLLLHRASMQAYKSYLENKDFKVHYIQSVSEEADCRALVKNLVKKGIEEILIAELTDKWLEQRMQTICKELKIELIIRQTPAFLNSMDEANKYFDKKNSYFQTNFYIQQRKQRNILVNNSKEPEGGKWSFDADNRKKYPAKKTAPVVSFPKQSQWVKDASAYVNKHFPDNYGSVNEFNYPVDFEAAEKWLDDFFKTRFNAFGDYEDAIVTKEHFLHHAVISPLINIGLLLPQQVLHKAMEAAVKYNVPLNSLEGFTRQVMGWREFIRIVYEREGNKQRTTNYWGFKRKIPASFWSGETGIEPIDATIKKILATGYCHHIERLMLLGNFMLLCEFDPDEVYRWFMEMFIDSYDWVMVPNVYGMTQFADGGLMTTKPYISGSNYILKMSDYKKGAWSEIWDGLFWRFMQVHRDFFEQNPRLGILLKTFDKMPAEKQEKHLTNASRFLKSLDEKTNSVEAN